MAFWRAAVAGIALLPILLIPKVRQSVRLVTWKRAGQIAAATVIIALHQICFISSLNYTSVAAATLLTSTQPMWTALLGGWLIREHVSARNLLAIGGALAGHAEAVLEAMSAEERSLAQTALLRLVTPARTRAVCTMAELRELAPVASDMDRVLGRLIDARLLAVAGRGEADATVQIVHHALISGWPTLILWLAASQEDALFLSRLRNAAIALTPDSATSTDISENALLKPVTTAVNADPTARPMAIETTLPRRMKSRNSLNMRRHYPSVGFRAPWPTTPPSSPSAAGASC